jgi:hypothetical protein
MKRQRSGGLVIGKRRSDFRWEVHGGVARLDAVHVAVAARAASRRVLGTLGKSSVAIVKVCAVAHPRNIAHAINC